MHKVALLALLKLPFVMVSSQILGETILFCEDEATKGALVEAGAEPWSIYTGMNCRRSASKTALRRSLPLNCGKSMRSNGRLTGGSLSEQRSHLTT